MEKWNFNISSLYPAIMFPDITSHTIHVYKKNIMEHMERAIDVKEWDMAQVYALEMIRIYDTGEYVK